MKYSDAELKKRAFERVAYVMRDMWEEKGSSDTRLLIPPLIPDEYVIVGASINGKGHKEHVVPRTVICNECHIMLHDNKSLKEVAAFIQKYLKIVHITKSEKNRLDKSSELNLRQRMPEGWSFEDGDIFSRLYEAKIEFILY